MSWNEDLKKIRRALRDPNGNIWSDAYLRNMYNDVQKDFQHKTRVLEDFSVQRVPDLYHVSYMHSWEHEELPSAYNTFYQCLTEHDDFAICHRWEAQAITGIDASVSDYGVKWTHPWEAFMGLTPGDEVRMKFPDNLRNLKFIAYDEEPIGRTTRKAVQSMNSSYITETGEPQAFFDASESDKEFVLYPRPSTAFADEIDGNEGAAFFIDGDTEDTTTGTVATRSGSTDTAQAGAAFDIIDVTNNLFMVYDVNPTDIVSSWDEGDYPAFLKKYIRYGVVGRAYGANTDGRIPSLAQYWSSRYEHGIQMAHRYRRNRKNDHDYRLMTQDPTRRRSRRHPRLPDAYPRTNP